MKLIKEPLYIVNDKNNKKESQIKCDRQLHTRICFEIFPPGSLHLLHKVMSEKRKI